MNDSTSTAALCAAALLLMLFAAFRTVDAAAEENFRWDEAAKFVDTLPYKPAFVDSLKNAYRITRPPAPLRTIMKQGFSEGEILVYDIGWGPFKAGYVILTATPDAASRTIRLGGKALSNGFVSTFYRMRDYVLSTIDDAGLYPLLFEQHLREGKRYRSDGWILYDNARCSLYVKERNVKMMSTPPFVNDYLSVLYLVRSKKFGPGDTFSLPLYADSKVHSIFFLCKERQSVRLNDRNVPCLVMRPRLVGDKGAFNKKDLLEVWLTDDDSKMPIQIKSKINIGSITARLIHSGKLTVKSTAAPKPPDTAKTRDTAARSETSSTRDTSLGADSAKVSNPPATGDTSPIHAAAPIQAAPKLPDTSAPHDSAKSPSP